MKKIFPSVLLAFLLAACVPQGIQVPQSPLLPLLERKSGLIAFVGLDGNMYITDQGGRSPEAITDDAVIPDGNGEFLFYQNPTWSLDGSQLAFVGASGDAQTQTASKMFVRSVDDETTTEIYSSETEFPFYLYWSPDNENVTFLSTSANGQSLLLQQATANGNGRVILDTGAPYYWSWAPDGKTMIVHAGSAASAAPERLAFLQVDSDVIEDGLDSTPAPFQAPAWSPDGSRILLTRASAEGGKEIVVLNSAGEFERSIAKFDVNAAFGWSPDGELIAHIAGSEAIGAGAIGNLHVTDVTAGEDFFQDTDVFAFFWSPNGKKLAYFKPLLANGSDASSQQLLLELNMLDVTSGESKKLFTFQPTNQFAGILPYFDQYAQSATIWSPDSNNLVLSFVDQEGNPGIAIVAASGQLEPRIISQGFIAFWSWR
jgi:Tol biopolymer transport system component